MACIKLANQKFSLQSFADQDFSGQDLSHSEFICCDFSRANLEKANCQASKFTGSDFTDSILRYTNFAYSDLQDTKFYPKDAYGIIFSLECRSFRGMKISRLWWYHFRFFSLMMIPDLEKGKDLRDHDISWMGDKYVRLNNIFRLRGM